MGTAMGTGIQRSAPGAPVFSGSEALGQYDIAVDGRHVGAIGYWDGRENGRSWSLHWPGEPTRYYASAEAAEAAARTLARQGAE